MTERIIASSDGVSGGRMRKAGTKTGLCVPSHTAFIFLGERNHGGEKHA